MKNGWKRRVLVAAIPIAAITVGCLAAQEDMDALIEDDAEFRTSVDPRLVRIRINDPGFGEILNNEAAQAAMQVWADIKEAQKEGGSHHLDDLILSSLIDERIGVVFDRNSRGQVDPCTIDIAEGAEALGAYRVQLRAYDSGAPGELRVMEAVESADSCDGDGFYFGEGEAGTASQISLCPESCDAIGGSAAEGNVVEMEMVVGEG